MVQSEQLKNIVTNTGQSLYDLSLEQPVLFVFLRHFGCIFCREALDDVAEIQHTLKEKGVTIVFVHMSDVSTAAQFFDEYKIVDPIHVSDPECAIYSSFGLTKGSFSQLYGLKVWTRGLKAKSRGLTYNLTQIGDGFQMPGVFVIHNGKVQNSYVHNLISDRPDYIDLVSCCTA